MIDMKNINRKELTLYIAITAIIGGISNLIFSPEPTILLNVAYALFMGVVIGGGLYFWEHRKRH